MAALVVPVTGHSTRSRLVRRTGVPPTSTSTALPVTPVVPALPAIVTRRPATPAGRTCTTSDRGPDAVAGSGPGGGAGRARGGRRRLRPPGRAVSVPSPAAGRDANSTPRPGAGRGT